MSYDLVDLEHYQMDVGWGEGLKFLGRLLGYPAKPPAGLGKRVDLHREPRKKSCVSKRLSQEESEDLRQVILKLAARTEGVISNEVMALTGHSKQAVYYSLEKLMSIDGLLTKEPMMLKSAKQASKCNVFKLKKEGE